MTKWLKAVFLGEHIDVAKTLNHLRRFAWEYTNAYDGPATEESEMLHVIAPQCYLLASLERPPPLVTAAFTARYISSPGLGL